MGISSDCEYLEELREYVVKFKEEVDHAIEKSDETNINRQQYGLVRNILRDLDERRSRQEFIHNLGPGTRSFIPPYDKEDSTGETDRKRSMIYLRNTIFTAWGEATGAYIAGRYYAATVTIAASIEGVLKHELEKKEVERIHRINLSDTVSRAKHGGILPHDGPVSDAAERLVIIRNNMIHFNVERGLADDVFSDPEYNKRGVQLDFDQFGETEKRQAAETAIEDAYTVADHIYELEDELE